MGDFWGNAWDWINSTVESGGDVVDSVANGVGTASDTYEKVATKLDALKSDTPNKSESESLAAWWSSRTKSGVSVAALVVGGGVLVAVVYLIARRR